MKPRVAALLLAAGQSRRMGTCKQLLPLNGKTVIDRCLESLLAGEVDEVVVVVGLQGDAVAEAVRAYPVIVARAVDPDGDMAASVRTGRDALPPDISGVIIALCDHPLVSPLTVARMVAAHRAEPGRIIVPLHEGRKGHPTLFPRPVLDELCEPLTLRDLLRNDSGRLLLLAVADHGVGIDMDTPEDYRRMVKLCQAVHSGGP